MGGRWHRLYELVPVHAYVYLLQLRLISSEFYPSSHFDTAVVHCWCVRVYVEEQRLESTVIRRPAWSDPPITLSSYHHTPTLLTPVRDTRRRRSARHAPPTSSPGLPLTPCRIPWTQSAKLTRQERFHRRPSSPCGALHDQMWMSRGRFPRKATMRTRIRMQMRMRTRRVPCQHRRRARRDRNAWRESQVWRT